MGMGGLGLGRSFITRSHTFRYLRNESIRQRDRPMDDEMTKITCPTRKPSCTGGFVTILRIRVSCTW